MIRSSLSSKGRGFSLGFGTPQSLYPYIPLRYGL